MKSTLLSLLALAMMSFAGIACSNENNTNKTNKTNLPTVTVYKSAGCSCCNRWIDHMSTNGFQVVSQNVDNLLSYKQKAKLGAGMGSCHTAFVDGYAIEGHVPAWDIKRMLTEKPDISGLTVPGMPIGTPGMETDGSKADAYQVISYKDGQETGVFSDYPAAD